MNYHPTLQFLPALGSFLAYCNSLFRFPDLYALITSAAVVFNDKALMSPLYTTYTNDRQQQAIVLTSYCSMKRLDTDITLKSQ